MARLQVVPTKCNGFTPPRFTPHDSASHRHIHLSVASHRHIHLSPQNNHLSHCDTGACTLISSAIPSLFPSHAARACNKALEGEAKRKYFEHAGALLTADGTDDDLIKFEGTPSGYQIKI